jgi:hypothetical protein
MNKILNIWCVGYNFKFCDFKSFFVFWDFQTHIFSCYLLSMVYVKKFALNLCDFVLCFLGFYWILLLNLCDSFFFGAWILILLHVSHILICMYQVSFKIFLYSVYIWIAMNHCMHSNKSTWYIKLFFFNKVVQNCTTNN